VNSLVVDTSAMVAVLTAEAGCEWILDRLASASECLMSAPTAVELCIVLEARVPAAVGIARRALRDAGIEVVPFDSRLVDRATDAWRRFGKGRHPARLTYGDCFTYALAEETGHPILCVGEDFGRTDISVVSAG
jgi:ribonuclease VapC